MNYFFKLFLKGPVGFKGFPPTLLSPRLRGKVVRKHQRGWARRARRLCRKVVFQGAGKRFKGFPPPYCPPACGGRWCVSTKGGGPAGPAGCVERLCFKGQGKGSKPSEGSAGKVDGAFGPEGCVEGLCPQRGNDSLHFMRRYRSYKMCSLCIAGAQGATAASPLRVVDCRWCGNKYKVSVTGLAFVSLWLPRHFERW